MYHGFESVNIGRVRASRRGYGDIRDSGIGIVPVPSVPDTTRPIRIGIGRYGEPWLEVLSSIMTR